MKAVPMEKRLMMEKKNLIWIWTMTFIMQLNNDRQVSSPALQLISSKTISKSRFQTAAKGQATSFNLINLISLQTVKLCQCFSTFFPSVRPRFLFPDANQNVFTVKSDNCKELFLPIYPLIFFNKTLCI